MSSAPLMPKATAVWLIENTSLTFEQIADFCGLHVLEVQGIADGEVAKGMQGMDPVLNGELTKDELARCEQDPEARLQGKSKSGLPEPQARSKGPRYTPVSKRADKPDAIAYLLKHHPEITDARIVKLIGTTKKTIQAVRERSHPNSSNIRPRHPVELGLCSYAELEAAIEKSGGRKEEAVESKEQEAQAPAYEGESRDNQSGRSSGGFDFSNFFSSGRDQETGS